MSNPNNSDFDAPPPGYDEAVRSHEEAQSIKIGEEQGSEAKSSPPPRYEDVIQVSEETEVDISEGAEKSKAAMKGTGLIVIILIWILWMLNKYKLI